MNERIIVTGATGFLGRHLMPQLAEAYPEAELIGLNRRDYDLTDRTAVRLMMKELRPTYLVHLAAYSGGIGANKEFPADFYYINTLLTSLVFHEAAQAKVNKMVYTMGGCSYPSGAQSPIKEDDMWNGFPQEESAPYSVAKKTGIVAAYAYRKQFGLNTTVLVPGNMYGEYDNFRLHESHVVPAMIRRYYEAKMSGKTEVIMWGSGAPVRDFVYAGDVAKLIPFFLKSEHFGPLNLSSGTTNSIKCLAETIKEKLDYKGAIRWDTSKPDGQMIKIFDVSKMKSIGLECPTNLDAGLEKTIEWFVRNYHNEGDGIRL